jgi:hypothetical protein
LNLWPNKRQWKTWSIPSRLTAISALLALLSLSFYFLEKAFNIFEWVLQDGPKPIVFIELQFPYERVDGSVKQNKRNPELTLTNRGLISISPFIVDVNMYTLSQFHDEIHTAATLSYKTHGHLIFEPELKPGSSVKASLAGIENWTQPVAYHVCAEVFIKNDKKFPILSLLYLVDKDGIKGEGSNLSKAEAQKIKATIMAFEKRNDVKKKLTIEAPIDGVWIPHAEPGINLHLNDDGTLTVK